MEDHNSLPPTAPPADREISSVPACANCGEWDLSPNVEAYEQTGDLMCDECADEMFEANAAYDREGAA